MERSHEAFVESALSAREQAYLDLAAAVSGPIGRMQPGLQSSETWQIALDAETVLSKQGCDTVELYQTHSPEGHFGIFIRRDGSTTVMRLDERSRPIGLAEPGEVTRVASRLWKASADQAA